MLIKVVEQDSFANLLRSFIHVKRLLTQYLILYHKGIFRLTKFKEKNEGFFSHLCFDN